MACNHMPELCECSHDLNIPSDHDERARPGGLLFVRKIDQSELKYVGAFWAHFVQKCRDLPRNHKILVFVKKLWYKAFHCLRP